MAVSVELINEGRVGKMSRTYVVTGSASGIGRATVELLIERGNRVIGVDIHDADVVVDLSTHEGRMDLVSKVTELSGGKIDAIIAMPDWPLQQPPPWQSTAMARPPRHPWRRCFRRTSNCRQTCSRATNRHHCFAGGYWRQTRTCRVRSVAPPSKRSRNGFVGARLNRLGPGPASLSMRLPPVASGVVETPMTAN